MVFNHTCFFIYSYTYIIKNIYSNPSDLLDTILKDDEILKRTTSVTKYYDDLIDRIPDDSIDAKKKKLYLTLVSINILEGIRFYVSFACSYCFAQNKKMEGNAKIISFINRDENLHMGFTTHVLRLLADEPSEGFQHIVKECEDIVYQMYKDAAAEEMEWAKYLFKDGTMIGLNSEILIQYMKWLTNNRLKAIRLDAIFERVPNPISWITNWTESKSIQEAPQETEKETYVVGAFQQLDDNENFDEFSM